MKLNENNTKLIQVNMQSNSSFGINNVAIEKVNSIKYLVFIIDSDLKLKEHLEYIFRKIQKKIGFLKRLRNKVSMLISINIYNAMLKSHFEYGSTILYTCCTEQQLTRLQTLQNKAMRSILQLNRFTPTTFTLDGLRWFNVHKRLELNMLNFIQKITIGEVLEYLNEQLKYVGEAQPHRLRNANNFRLQLTDTGAMQKSLYYRGLNTYNKMPNYLKNERNINVFRKNVVNFVKNNSN